MQSANDNKEKKNLKRLRSSSFCDMPVTDFTATQTLDDCIFFPSEEVVQSPLLGYSAPTIIGFSPDDSLVTYLLSPDQSLSRKVFAFDLHTGKQ